MIGALVAGFLYFDLVIAPGKRGAGGAGAGRLATEQVVLGRAAQRGGARAVLVA